MPSSGLLERFFSMREESSSAVTPGAQRRSAAVYQSSRNSNFRHELWPASLALGRDSFSPGATFGAAHGCSLLAGVNGVEGFGIRLFTLETQ